MNITFYEYYCGCGKYLFQTSNIEKSVLTSNYIFVKDKENSEVSANIALNQYVNGVKTINCCDCNFALGGYVYRQHQHNENLFRFIRSRILRKRVSLTFRESPEVREGPFIHIPQNSTAVISPIPSLMTVYTSGDICTPDDEVTTFYRNSTSDDN